MRRRQWSEGVDVTAVDEALLRKVNEDDPSLQWINLSWTHLGEGGARALAGAIGRNSTVTDLVLAQCLIGDEGAKYLANALRRNHAISHLNLQCNGISGEGAKALAGALRQNDTVTHLFMMDNDIGPEGAGAIVDAICQERSAVTWIILSSNRIGAEGAEAVARALRGGSGKRIETFELGSNGIDDEGARVLANALSLNNTPIKSLDLSWNNIGSEGCEALASALCHGSAVSDLNLDGNKFDDARVAAAFARAVVSHPTRMRINLRDIAEARYICSDSQKVTVKDAIQLIHDMVGVSLWGMNPKEHHHLLEALNRAGTLRVVQESHKVQDSIVPLLLQRLGVIFGISGIFGSIRTRPDLFQCVRLKKQ